MNRDNDIIAWWSGGVTSAVTCKLCIDLFGGGNVRIIFIDTKNEDEDTYRFKADCEKWYGKKIETITGIGEKYKNIRDVWIRFLSLNTAHGAICSSELKREIRIAWQRDNKYKYQAFGFDIDESKRAKGMSVNYPDSKPIFPLLLHAYSKKDCIRLIEEAGYEVPRVYKYGYQNNNCFKTGCVQGGIGYWQKIQRDNIEKFNEMALIEHTLTNLKGKPVTMLKDQGRGGGLVFLLPHKDYSNLKDISMMKGREPKPLFECNGFCGINDLSERVVTEKEINYEKI